MPKYFRCILVLSLLFCSVSCSGENESNSPVSLGSGVTNNTIYDTEAELQAETEAILMIIDSLLLED